MNQPKTTSEALLAEIKRQTEWIRRLFLLQLIVFVLVPIIGGIAYMLRGDALLAICVLIGGAVLVVFTLLA